MSHTPSMSLSLVALLTLASALASPAEAQCATPSFDSLFARVPSAQRADLVTDPSHHTSRAATIELDGAAPAEAVLAVDSLVPELESDLGTALTGIFVFRCRGAGWALLGRVDFEIDAGWDGTYDTRPGVVVLSAETLPGVGHDFARIEHVDVRGSFDPRFVSRRLALLHVVGDEVVTAFDAVVRVDTEAGPERAQISSVTRSVVYRRTRPAAIRFRVRETTPERGARTVCSTVFTFDGHTFVPADPSCQ